MSSSTECQAKIVRFSAADRAGERAVMAYLSYHPRNLHRNLLQRGRDRPYRPPSCFERAGLMSREGSVQHQRAAIVLVL